MRHLGSHWEVVKVTTDELWLSANTKQVGRQRQSTMHTHTHCRGPERSCGGGCGKWRWEFPGGGTLPSHMPIFGRSAGKPLSMIYHRSLNTLFPSHFLLRVLLMGACLNQRDQAFSSPPYRFWYVFSVVIVVVCTSVTEVLRCWIVRHSSFGW